MSCCECQDFQKFARVSVREFQDSQKVYKSECVRMCVCVSVLESQDFPNFARVSEYLRVFKSVQDF